MVIPTHIEEEYIALYKKMTTGIQQIKAWLKSGVIDNKTFLETEEGTPQGGVISPLLANIALHGLESHLNEFAKTIDMKRPPDASRPGSRLRQEGWQVKVSSLNFVRYADDFVLMHKDKKVILDGKKVIEKWLSQVGLELKPSKTRIAHTLISKEREDGNAGFDFLGFHIRQFKTGKHSSKKGSTGKPLGFRTLITPTKEAYSKHQKKLRTTIKNKKIEGEKIRLPKIGWIKVVFDRRYIGTIKTVTVTKDRTDKYFASIIYEIEACFVSGLGDKILGIDLGIKISEQKESECCGATLLLFKQLRNAHQDKSRME